MSSTVPHPVHWLFEHALPYWVHHAIDPQTGGFVDRLSHDGAPCCDEPKTTLVQARMLYTCAHGAFWGGGAECATGIEAAYRFLTERLYDPSSGGFVRAVGHDGRPDGRGANPVRDTYDHSFVLLGLAALYRLDPGRDVMGWITTTWVYLENCLLESETGAYHEDSRALAPGEIYPMPRRQNPHMHLFEALLALFEATGQGAWMEHAQRLLGVFRSYLFDPATGSVREFVGRRLEPAPPPIGLIREPGHQFEWAWLLHRYAALSGDGSAVPHAHALYEFGTSHGTHPSGAMKGAIYDQVAPSGAPLKTSMLLWPQTEAAKAHLARYEETGDEVYRKRAEAATRLVFEHFVSPDRPTWRNQVDENGATLQADAPTRLLYHVIVFILEGERLGAWPHRSPRADR